MLEFTILHQVFHLLLLALGLVRDEFVSPHCQIFVSADVGADPGTPESSGASSHFRSSTLTRVCWHHQCSTSTCRSRSACSGGSSGGR